MAGTRITHFEPDPERLAVIRECMENYEVGDPQADWPNNVISRHTVVYGSGVIARRSVAVQHSVDPDELALCRRLATEVAELMADVDVGMGSESGDPFRAFYIAANGEKSAPSAIDEALIRASFGDTIFPPIPITVEPISESGIWWSEVEFDGSESEPDYFVPWRNMIRWFQGRQEFKDRAFIRIGDGEFVPPEQLPAGTEMAGCVLPRLALGLTHGGSLVGLFGHSVKT
jgi:hypothetical protein